MSRRRTWVAALIALVTAVPVFPVEASRGRIVCESRNRNFNECRVRTEDSVRLVRQLSRDECRRNRSWGFDSRRIWVDRGCRAEFEFGRNSRSSNRSDAAIAAGVIGAVALGAAMSGGGGAQQPQQFPPPPPLTPRPDTGTLPVPTWAIGSFSAWDPEAGQLVQLVIQPDGRATLRDSFGQTINWGDLRDGFIVWSQGTRSWFAREGHDLVVGEVGTPRVFDFVRS